MDILELAAVFTTAGALAWSAIVIFGTELLKRLSPMAEHGRAPMYAAATLSALIVGLATWDALSTGLFVVGPSLIVSVIFAWINITAAAIGLHTTAQKAGNVIQGTTNPSGPDGP
jgi:hypothetical protein